MKAPLLLLTLLCFAFTMPVEAKIPQSALKSVLADKISRIERLASKPAVIKAVKAQNKQRLSLDKIKQTDKAWRKKATPMYQELTSNKIAKIFSKQIKRDSKTFSEMFLTDNQGANVACFPATSDYWQGDETKWTASYNNGKGQVFVGDVEHDESSKTDAVQVSVPVLDNGKTIGVLVVGIKLDFVESKGLR